MYRASSCQWHRPGMPAVYDDSQLYDYDLASPDITSPAVAAKSYADDISVAQIPAAGDGNLASQQSLAQSAFSGVIFNRDSCLDFLLASHPKGEPITWLGIPLLEARYPTLALGPDLADAPARQDLLQALGGFVPPPPEERIVINNNNDNNNNNSNINKTINTK